MIGPRIRLTAALTLLAGLCSLAPLHALDVSLAAADLDRALTIARGSDADRARFHARYVFTDLSPEVERLEAITEFRRVVLVGEEHGQAGDWLFLHSTGSAEKAVARWRGLVTITARLRFHPQNILVSVPPCAIVMGGGAGESAPVAVDTRTSPIWSLPFGPKDSPSTALLGATVDADFRASAIGQARRAIGVRLDGKDVARVSIDFGRLE